MSRRGTEAPGRATNVALLLALEGPMVLCERPCPLINRGILVEG